MNIRKAKSLYALNIENMSYESLLKHRVNLIDAWRQSRADYGFREAVKNGFYASIASESASGYSPKDIWLTHNIEERLGEVESLLSALDKR